MPLAVAMWNLNHWTAREVPKEIFLKHRHVHDSLLFLNLIFFNLCF